MNLENIKEIMSESEWEQLDCTHNAHYKQNKMAINKIIAKYPFFVPREILFLKQNKNNLEKINIFCANCGNKNPFRIDSVSYRTYCSSKCASTSILVIEKSKKSHMLPNGSYYSNREKAKQTCLEKYGVSNPTKLKAVREKIKKTKLERYGNENYNNVEKAQKTCLGKYGVEHFSQLKESKLKISNLWLDKQWADNNIKNNKKSKLELHGNENYNNRKKAKQTCLEKYGVEHPNKRKEYHKNFFNREHINFEDINEKFFRENFIIDGYFDVEKCKNYFKTKTHWVFLKRKQFNIKEPVKHIISESQNEIKKFIENKVNNPVNYNDRSIIHPKELDIYIPDSKLAIEYDGLLFHSYGKSDYSIFNDIEEDKNYHLNKTKLCKEKGIQLLHIFENEWEEKCDIWKSVILNKLGLSNKIYARKCVLKLVDNKVKDEFLIKNHLQGSCPSTVNIGLYYNNELVSLMTFGKSRYNKNYDWELLRYCNKLNISVVGGASKLLFYFRKNYKGSIISYANKRWSDGNLYKKLGFDLVNESCPNYYYFKPNECILYSRIQFQKHKLKDKLDIFDDKLTETQNMYNNGYRKIYDCGNYVFELL